MSKDSLCGAETRDGNPCQRPPSKGRDRCHYHGGATPTKEENPDQGAPEGNTNAVKHWLHSSAEVFFENAEEKHLDTYYALHESLCTRYQQLHGSLPEHIKKDLAEIAFEMTKLDMAKEYEAENAADPGKPLTEMQEEMTESGPWEKEVVSKVESLKTQIRRENRLALKDMGIYSSPEMVQAEATRSLSEVLSEKD